MTMGKDAGRDAFVLPRRATLAAASSSARTVSSATALMVRQLDLPPLSIFARGCSSHKRLIVRGLIPLQAGMIAVTTNLTDHQRPFSVSTAEERRPLIHGERSGASASYRSS